MPAGLYNRSFSVLGKYNLVTMYRQGLSTLLPSNAFYLRLNAGMGH